KHSYHTNQKKTARLQKSVPPCYLPPGHDHHKGWSLRGRGNLRRGFRVSTQKGHQRWILNSPKSTSWLTKARSPLHAMRSDHITKSLSVVMIFPAGSGRS